MKQARGRCFERLVIDPTFFPNYLANRRPHRSLRDELNVCIGIAFPPLAFKNGSELAATRSIACTWHSFSELAIGVEGIRA